MRGRHRKEELSKRRFVFNQLILRGAIFLSTYLQRTKAGYNSGYDTPASGRIELSGPPGIIRPLRLVNIWMGRIRILTSVMIIMIMFMLTMIGKRKSNI